MEKQSPKIEAHKRNQGPAGDSDKTEEDPVERMLSETGCLEKHYAVQNCIADNADWRKCQKEVEDFRICIETHKKNNNRH